MVSLPLYVPESFSVKPSIVALNYIEDNRKTLNKLHAFVRVKNSPAECAHRKIPNSARLETGAAGEVKLSLPRRLLAHRLSRSFHVIFPFSRAE
jgi:hypothetical protein